MRHIDKFLNRQKGERIVSEFLDRFYSRRKAYPDDMYKSFGQEFDDNHDHAKYKQRLVNEVLLPDQNGLCCYCLRKLSECRKMTVEHIMPNHAADKKELDEYRKRPTALDGLPHANNFRAMADVKYPPHPHSIAYQNLVLSCDGDLLKENAKPVCCNLKRGHRFVPPFVLYEDIEQTFQYMADGTAEWTEDPEPPESKENAVRILGLNTSLLKMIRRIWFFCNDNGIDVLSTDKDVIVNTMIGYIANPDTMEREIHSLLNFKKDKYWKLLLEYDAFADIRHY